MKIQSLQKRLNPLAVAFALPVVCMLIVMLIGGFSPFGTSSMLYSDMFHQYYPFFVAFRDALRSGDSLLYSWRVGMGMDYLGLISYYLASPLYLLGVLVPKSLLLPFFSLLMPVKLGIASLSFAYLLRKIYGKNDLSLAMFGSFYAMCAWALGYQWNIMWLDSFAVLPLVVLGTIALLRDKKFVLYTVTLFFSLFSNYYIGFFVCIFVALVFFCYEICCWRGFGRFLLDLARIAFFSVLAIAMTAVLELPAFAALQNTQSSVNAFPQGFKLNIAKENTWLGFLDAMRQVAGNTAGGISPTFKEGLPNLYCGVGMMLLCFIGLTCKNIKLRTKLCTVFLLLFFMASFILRQLDYIWHGFHFTNMIPYRFSFLFSFVVLFLAYQTWLNRESLKLWQIILGGICAAALFACSDQRTDPMFLAYNGCFLLAFCLTLGFGALEEHCPEDAEPEEIQEAAQIVRQQKAQSGGILLLVFLLELSMNVLNFGVNFTGTLVRDYPRGKNDIALTMKYLHATEDDLFYRMDTTHTQTLNDGALIGYNGVTTFTSSANVKVTEFMKALGYGAKNTYNRYAFEESSPVANLFLNLKYMLERDGNVEENSYFTGVFHSNIVTLLNNQVYLPLGFLAEPKLAELSFENAEPFDFQNKLLRAATGITEDAWHVVDDYEITAEDANLASQVGWGYCSYDGCGSNAAIVYTFRPNRPGFLCLNLTVSARNSFTVRRNDQELYSETLSLPQMIAVSEVLPGDTITVRLPCKADETGNMTLHAAVLDASIFRQGYDVLRSSTLELTEFSNTRVAGTIDCDRDGLLYTSIPQDGNWSAQVDGKDAEIRLVGDAMIGLELPKGQHEVRFTYHNEAFDLGWKITLGATVILLLLTAVSYLPKRKK